MPRVNRREIFSETDVQVFHTISRCVRRNHLCGRDRRSGQDYSHRREWIRSRLEELAGIFAIETLGYALMANHMHLVVRTRPDVAATWSDDEIALRWWALFPKRRTLDGRPEQPTTEELNHIKSSATGLADKRRRLTSISWFMKCISEPIAKRANRDDQVTGHFWEARYKAQPLLDETAIAACLAYVDLNPIRAAVAQTPETSQFTSIHDRISDRQSAAAAADTVAETTADIVAGADTAAATPSTTIQAALAEHGTHAGWLAPIALEPACQASSDCPTSRRLTNRGCLFMTLDQYLQLVDWTGRQLRLDKPGHIPEHLTAILTRLDCSLEAWLDLVKNFRRRFPTEAGRPETLLTVTQLRRDCRRSNQHSLHIAPHHSSEPASAGISAAGS
jgi:REP element-mobilizing transposase RayT